MPKYAVHMIVAEEAFNKLKQSSNPSEQEIGKLIDTHRQAVVLGSTGPDLFFWAPDYAIVKWPLQFYKNLEGLIELYDNTIGLAKDTIVQLGKPVKDAVSSLAPHTIETIELLISEIGETMSLFKSTLATGLFAGVIQGYDYFAHMGDLPSLSHTIFDYFTPPLQKDGTDEETWYWFDMLHYRFTGEFAQNLINLATTEEQKAYAYGYLTHIATDTVGHPFVNQIVGGPYRLHPQRHATCENFIDTWAYNDQYGENINKTFHDRAKLPKSKKLHQMDYQLSSDIANLLHKALLDTYGGLPHPGKINTDKGKEAGFLTLENIQETYKVFCFVMEVMSKSYVEKPEEPFSGILDILNDILKDFKAPPSPPYTSSACSIWDILAFGTTQKSRDCYENFAKNIANWLEYVGELLNWLFDTIMNLLDLLTTLLLSLPIAAVMAILYGLQMLLYNIYRQARFVLAINGFVNPEPDEVTESSFGRNFITPYQCIYIVTGLPEEDFTGVEITYPRTHSCKLNHLQCPSTPSETPTAACAWYSRDENSTPKTFIKNQAFVESNLQLYAQAKSPQKTREKEDKRMEIGNAIDFSTWLIKNAHNKSKKDFVYCDWNLDADRGYGYKCWKASNLPNINLVGEDYF